MEQASDEYLRRPEVTVGYAVVGQQKEPYPSTVATSERGAMVSGLVSLFGEMVYATDSDAAIEARFQQMAKPRALSVSAVLIEAVDVVPDSI